MGGYELFASQQFERGETYYYELTSPADDLTSIDDMNTGLREQCDILTTMI